MRARLIVLMIVLGAAISASASTEKKPAWALSDEERIARRMDRALAAERVRANIADRARLRVEFGQPLPDPLVEPLDAIVGRRNPELFLPTELFESLVSRSYFGQAAGAWREIHAKDLRTAGLPPDFWERLEQVIPAYLEAASRERSLYDRGRHADEAMRAGLEKEVTGMQPTLCWLRFDALQAARAAFGIALDRFLYEGIAVTKSVSYFETTPSADALRLKARGCR